MFHHPALRAGLAIVAIALAPGLAQAQATQSAEGLPTGEVPVGTTYVAETHGDWEIRCIRAEEGQPEPCQLYQLLRDSNGGAVAEFNIFDIPDEGALVAGATIVTPLETLLTPGIRLRVDEGNWSEYPFAFCQTIGCFARLGLTQDDITALRRGSTATVALVPLPAPDQLVQIAASLAGFTAGFAALEARNAAALSLLEQLRQDAAASPPAQ
ncbi:invasion associated locus B family protein [Roseicyclus sp.]|uniref:invasion associated locus B family protein n=1 Tax=Roseicyclus sp. TaxID=1914329 RepID=UPI003F6BD882